MPENRKPEPRPVQQPKAAGDSIASDSPRNESSVAESFCPRCDGEGVTWHPAPYAISYGHYSARRCDLCDTEGIIHTKELYGCQNCGVIVQGETLVKLDISGIPCRCGDPVINFHKTAPEDYPGDSDLWDEAVWEFSEFKEENHG